MNHLKYIILIKIILLFFLAGCSGIKEEKTKTASDLYIEAMELFNKKSYIESAQKFEEIYDEYPLSDWSLKAQAVAAYINFLQKNYEEVIRISTSFSQINPNSIYVPYVQYLKSLSYFNLIPNVKRGQNYTKEASYNFRELVARFPNSKYIDDAKDKILIINEHLAGAKMSIGRYEINQQNYIGAILNFNEVIYSYSKTNQAAEAYARLFEIYYKLGMIDEANNIKSEMLNYHKKGFWVDYIKDISSKL